MAIVLILNVNRGKNKLEKKLTMYPAIFTKNDDGSYTVKFIDLKGCITEGNDLKDAFYMAEEALGLYLDEDMKFPKPTTDFSKIKLGSNQFINYVIIDMDEFHKKYGEKSVSKNLTIPAWLNTISEKNNINFSQVLQKALKKELKID